jgi:uncharacterized protein
LEERTGGSAVARAVLDPNVLVSALISPGGIPARLLVAAEDGRYELVVSARLLDELEGVLMRDKFRRYFPEEAVEDHLERLLAVATMGEEAEIRHDSPDPKDDYLVALARATGSEALVTGDAHLLGLGMVVPVMIISPREFLEELGRAG